MNSGQKTVPGWIMCHDTEVHSLIGKQEYVLTHAQHGVSSLLGTYVHIHVLVTFFNIITATVTLSKVFTLFGATHSNTQQHTVTHSNTLVLLHNAPYKLYIFYL